MIGSTPTVRECMVRSPPEALGASDKGSGGLRRERFLPFMPERYGRVRGSTKLSILGRITAPDDLRQRPMT